MDYHFLFSTRQNEQQCTTALLSAQVYRDLYQLWVAKRDYSLRYIVGYTYASLYQRLSRCHFLKPVLTAN